MRVRAKKEGKMMKEGEPRFKEEFGRVFISK
jgi:hypothetical protein